MKKVSGYIWVHALGEYKFEFYVEDDTTDEEIEKMAHDAADYGVSYRVEEGYVAEQQTVYRKAY